MHSLSGPRVKRLLSEQALHTALYRGDGTGPAKSEEKLKEAFQNSDSSPGGRQFNLSGPARSTFGMSNYFMKRQRCEENLQQFKDKFR
jgi:hypothetical protein